MKRCLIWQVLPFPNFPQGRASPALLQATLSTHCMLGWDKTTGDPEPTLMLTERTAKGILQGARSLT